MKEKITKAEFINTWASEWDERTGWKVSEIYHQQMSEQLESLINQEVEKRIAERMPSEEEINKQAEQAAQRDTKDGRIGIIIDSTYYGVFCDALEWLRSRLTNPESSQKTEGGAK